MNENSKLKYFKRESDLDQCKFYGDIRKLGHFRRTCAKPSPIRHQFMTIIAFAAKRCDLEVALIFSAASDDGHVF